MARPKNEFSNEKCEKKKIKCEMLTELEVPLQKVITSIRKIADNVRKG